ncbi:major royal jelly protein [Xylariaceae sp. FL0662B]|nr:major royal jelly protein [Xylariaceae sp. FL0662B]
MWLPLIIYAASAVGSIIPAPEDPRVQLALTLDTPSTGVSTTPDGRLFILYARVDGSTGPGIVEWDNSTQTATPFPDAEWNNYTTDKDPATHFINANAQRIGPDGALWIVDTGLPSLGQPAILPAGPKVVQVNLTTNAVQRVYGMGNATLSTSLLDDIRFNPATGKAYFTDAGAPALIVLDLATGNALRVLNNHQSTSAYMPQSAEGALLRGPYPSQGFAYVYADQLEVSPDGKFLYYQPASGGMSRIETGYLDDALYNSSLAETLPQYVEPYVLTPPTGGTAMDAQGNIWSSDVNRQSILKTAPNGTSSVIVQDPRLLWIDAMWIDTHGKLWMPAAQLNRGIPFQNGTSKVVKPLHVYTMDIGVGPSSIDHQ